VEEKEEEEPPEESLEAPQEEVAVEAGSAKARPTGYSQTEHRL
jgi:hypothetical protein